MAGGEGADWGGARRARPAAAAKAPLSYSLPPLGLVRQRGPAKQLRPI